MGFNSGFKGLNFVVSGPYFHVVCMYINNEETQENTVGLSAFLLSFFIIEPVIVKNQVLYFTVSKNCEKRVCYTLCFLLG